MNARRQHPDLIGLLLGVCIPHTCREKNNSIEFSSGNLQSVNDEEVENEGDIERIRTDGTTQKQETEVPDK